MAGPTASISDSRALRQCYYEYAGMFQGIEVITNGKNNLNGQKMLGATDAFDNAECLKLTKPQARGKACNSETNPQHLRFDQVKAQESGSKCSLKTMVTTGFLAMQAARGVTTSMPYDSDADAYRPKCVSGHNDMGATMYTNAPGIYPMSESEKCSATDRHGASDSFIMGPGLWANMPSSKITVKLEVSMFDPNAWNSDASKPVCQKPTLTCKVSGGSGKWYANNLAPVKVRAMPVGSSTNKWVQHNAATEYQLAYHDDEEAQAELSASNKIDDIVTHKAVTGVGVAVVEHESVIMKLTESGQADKKAVVGYLGSTNANNSPIDLSWAHGVITVKDTSGNPRRVYAVKDALPAGFTAVSCDKAEVSKEIEAFNDGTKSAPHGAVEEAASPASQSTPSRRLLQSGKTGRKLLSYHDSNPMHGAVHPLSYVQESYFISQPGSSANAEAAAMVVVEQVPVTTTPVTTTPVTTTTVAPATHTTTASIQRLEDKIDIHNDDHHDDSVSMNGGVWAAIVIASIFVIACVGFMIYSAVQSKMNCDKTTSQQGVYANVCKSEHDVNVNVRGVDKDGNPCSSARTYRKNTKDFHQL